jgi:hypothetical protein
MLRLYRFKLRHFEATLFTNYIHIIGDEAILLLKNSPFKAMKQHNFLTCKIFQSMKRFYRFKNRHFKGTVQRDGSGRN